MWSGVFYIVNQNKREAQHCGDMQFFLNIVVAFGNSLMGLFHMMRLSKTYHSVLLHTKTPYHDSLMISILLKIPLLYCLQVLVLLLMQIHLESISPYINLLGLRGRTWFVSGKFPLALKWESAKLIYSWEISFTQQLMDWSSGITEGEGRWY